jgi:hypothetical protein
MITKVRSVCKTWGESAMVEDCRACIGKILTTGSRFRRVD